MGDTYRGGHTKVFISQSGTSWEVPDHSQVVADPGVRKRWDEETVGEAGDRPEVEKQARSFLSMCAMAFWHDALTNESPPALPELKKQVRRAGGNKRWIVGSATRLGLFEQYYKKH